MKKQLLSAVLSAGLFLGAAGQADAAVIHQRARHHYVQHSSSIKHKRHMKTVKRVGVGAAGGAAIGALAGGRKRGRYRCPRGSWGRSAVRSAPKAQGTLAA